MARKTKEKQQSVNQSRKRSYIKQTDVPATALDDTLRVPRAILDNYAGQSTSPFNVAKALDVEPKGRQLVNLCGAAIAYGLIEGGAQAESISITPLANKILRPPKEGDDVAGRREALLKPRIFKEFLVKYDGNAFPRDDIAKNVLIEMGVAKEKADEVLTRIVESAESVGFIEELRGKKYIHLEGVPKVPAVPKEEGKIVEEEEKLLPLGKSEAPPIVHKVDAARRRRVFITHGRNKEIIPNIKKLLEYGELEPVVSVEKQSVSKPVPEKLMAEMRSCGAGIIHVEAEETVIDKEDHEHVILNPNVLIEIGAAMAFYGHRFILLVREGAKLPSNLQGLYEVRYSGDTLDADVTIRLLEAIKDIKNYPMPEEEAVPHQEDKPMKS
jgi:hypothetical protein